MEEADSIAEYLRVTGYTRCIWATEEGEVIKETLAEMSQGHLLTRERLGNPVILVLNLYSAVLSPCMKLNHLRKLYFETGKSI